MTRTPRDAEHSWPASSSDCDTFLALAFPDQRYTHDLSGLGLSAHAADSGATRRAAPSPMLGRPEVGIAQMMALRLMMPVPSTIKNTGQPSNHEHVWLYLMVRRPILQLSGGSFPRKPARANPPQPIKGGGRPLDTGGSFVSSGLRVSFCSDGRRTDGPQTRWRPEGRRMGGKLS
jgi:hypothetical protein